MASAAKRLRTVAVSAEEVSELLEEEDSSNEGMSSDEESDLDRQMQSSSDELSDEEDYAAPVAPPAPAAAVAPAAPHAPVGAPMVPAAPVAHAAPLDPPAPVAVVAPAAPHAPGAFYAAPRGRGHGPRVARAAAPAAAAPAGRGRGPRAARAAAAAAAAAPAARGRGAAMNFQSYRTNDNGNPLPPFTPTRPTGIHFGRPHLRGTMTKEVEFFSLFFTNEMIDEICAHTNSYANQHIIEGTHESYTQSDGSWKDTTRDEIKSLIALLIYCGLVQVGNVERYWSAKSLYNGLWARDIMARIRFKALMSLLHVVDPGAETPGDKLRKVESFINYFKSRCIDLYQPRQQLAIDERMVKSRHRSGIRQYIKDKPTKWGIKLWVLADSSNGYTIDFNVYIGRAAVGEVSANGLGYDVVVKLMQPFLNQGYHLYIDNFYTSSVLLKYLFDQGVPCTGTIRENSRGFPANMKNGKQWSKASNVERGSMRWERDPPILALQWLDNKVVSMLTTIENANDSLQVRRKTKTAGVWRTRFIQQPQAIATYNQYMNAVDRSDQMLATNNVLRKCMQWWKTLFFHLIDIAVVNSFILFREHQTQFPDVEELRRTAGYSLSHFREELVRQICGFPEYSAPTLASATRQVPDPHEFESVHMPEFIDMRRNCVVCYKQGRGQLKVFSRCSAPQCQEKHMHVTKERNCFKEFHSREYHNT